MRVSTKFDGKSVTEVGGSNFADDWPAPGHYQFLVTAIEVQPEKLKNMIVIGLEVVAGSVPGQEGKRPDLLLWYDPTHEKWSKDFEDRIARLFWAMGLIEENADATEINEQHAIGKCFIGEVGKVKRKKSKEDPTKIEVVDMLPGKFWRIGHAEVQGLVPVDEKIAAAAARGNAPDTDKRATAGDELGDL